MIQDGTINTSEVSQEYQTQFLNYEPVEFVSHNGYVSHNAFIDFSSNTQGDCIKTLDTTLEDNQDFYLVVFTGSGTLKYLQKHNTDEIGFDEHLKYETIFVYDEVLNQMTYRTTRIYSTIDYAVSIGVVLVTAFVLYGGIALYVRKKCFTRQTDVQLENVELVIYDLIFLFTGVISMISIVLIQLYSLGFSQVIQSLIVANGAGYGLWLLFNYFRQHFISMKEMLYPFLVSVGLSTLLYIILLFALR